MAAAAAQCLIVGSQTVYADSLTTDALGTTFPMSSGVDAVRGAHGPGEWGRCQAPVATTTAGCDSALSGTSHSRECGDRLQLFPGQACDTLFQQPEEIRQGHRDAAPSRTASSGLGPGFPLDRLQGPSGRAGPGAWGPRGSFQE